MGGGVMRTAAKAAVLGGYRSTGSFGEAAASRRIPRPSTAAVPDGEARSSISFLSSETTRPAAPLVSAIQRIDDWEFAGGREDELFDALHPVPRLVFGPVPTLEEAKEATSDLKDALEKVYFSSNAAEGHVKSSQDLNSCESSEISSPMPKHVFQAFSLLQESPEAQSVVASLASDRNVWDAIMNNDMVIKFYASHQSVAIPLETNLDPEESVTGSESDREYLESPKAPHKKKGFSDWVLNIREKVSEVVSNISVLLHDFMGSLTQSTDANTSMSTSTEGSSANATMGLSFLALAAAAILVILFKRGA